MMGSGILGQAVGDTLYINALGHLGVTRTFPITNSAYPFVTFLLAVVLLGEAVTWTLPFGGALIVAGITWIVLEQRRADAAGRSEGRTGARRPLRARRRRAWATATVWLRGQQGDLDALGAASLRIPAASVAVWFTIAMTRGRGDAPLPPTYADAASPSSPRAGVLGTGLGSILFIYSVEQIRRGENRLPHHLRPRLRPADGRPLPLREASPPASSSAPPSPSPASGSC